MPWMRVKRTRPTRNCMGTDLYHTESHESNHINGTGGYHRVHLGASSSSTGPVKVLFREIPLPVRYMYVLGCTWETVTVSKFLLEPLQHLGEGVNRMVTTCLKDLPVHLWPIVLPILLLMLLVMGFGYKIHIVHLFGLEPSKTPMLQANDRMLLQKIINKLDYIQPPRRHHRSRPIRRIWR